MTIKYALTIPKPAIFNETVYITPTVRELLQATPTLEDRATCETDLSKVQLIPYIALVDTSEDEPKYFVYTRGKASGENRLVGKCSIGLGGHMEEALDIKGEPKTHVARFAHLIAECAVREIEEEVGIRLSHVEFVNAILPKFYKFDIKFEDVLAIPETSVLYTPISEVDAVHVGITFAVNVKPTDITDLEKDVITRGRWMTHAEIIEACSPGNNPIVLETWSHLLLGQLNSKLSKLPEESTVAA